jgi:hypothetical protein
MGVAPKRGTRPKTETIPQHSFSGIVFTETHLFFAQALIASRMHAVQSSRRSTKAKHQTLTTEIETPNAEL